MLISIVITVYNKEKYISQCIKSVLNQHYENLDIIIINDGSSDDSEIIINKYLSDNRIRYFKQKNQGVADTRNRGIKLSKGDYIYFVDGDDELPKDSISQLVNKIENNTDMVVGNFIYKSKSKNIKNKALQKGHFGDKVEIKSTQLKYDMFISNGRPLSSVCNKLYNRKFLISNSIYFEKDVLAEDRLFNLYCYCNYPNLILTNDYTYIVNLIDNSRSRSYIEDFYTTIINLSIKFREYLLKNDMLEEHKDLEFFNLINNIESIHRYILKYSPNKYKNIRNYTKLIKKNRLFGSILKNGLKKKYFNQLEYNNKKWFLIVYAALIVYLPALILPLIYTSDLLLKFKTKIKRL